jgi:hypothetical protein
MVPHNIVYNTDVIFIVYFRLIIHLFVLSCIEFTFLLYFNGDKRFIRLRPLIL